MVGRENAKPRPTKDRTDDGNPCAAQLFLCQQSERQSAVSHRPYRSAAVRRPNPFRPHLARVAGRIAERAVEFSQPLGV
jgi:hypothetical protein